MEGLLKLFVNLEELSISFQRGETAYKAKILQGRKYLRYRILPLIAVAILSQRLVIYRMKL